MSKTTTVKAGTIKIETHWEQKPSSKRPSFIRIIQDGEVIAYEMFAPPAKHIKP